MATVKQSSPGVPADAGESKGPSFVSRGSDGPLPAPGPWNPGLRSPMPRAVQSLCTLFRPENAFTSLAEVRELSDFTGLPEVELVAFRPRRLAMHELLIRVAANLSIPDEEDTDALGVNFRRVARTIEERCFDSTVRQPRCRLRGIARTCPGKGERRPRRSARSPRDLASRPSTGLESAPRPFDLPVSSGELPVTGRAGGRCARRVAPPRDGGRT